VRAAAPAQTPTPALALAQAQAQVAERAIATSKRTTYLVRDVSEAELNAWLEERRAEISTVWEQEEVWDEEEPGVEGQLGGRR
jgi:hypothetical protein